MSTRAIRVGTFVGALVVILAARDGAAQSRGAARPLFVGASVAANIDNSVWAASGPDAHRRHGGDRVGRRLQLRGPVVPAGRGRVANVGPDGGHPVSTGSPYGSPYGYQPYSSVTRTSYRTSDCRGAVRRPLRPSKRVDVALQFGPSLRGEQRDYEAQTLVNGAVMESHQDTWTDWHLRVSAGGEVAVAVTPRVAVVGQLRVHLAHLDEVSSGAVTRPAIGVRVRF